MSSSRRIIFIFLALAVLGLRYYLAIPKFEPTFVGSYRGEALTVRAMVADEPDEGLSRVQFGVDVDALRKFGTWFHLYGHVVVRSQNIPDIHYGDSVELTGILQEPLRADPRIGATMNRPKIKLLAKAEGSYFYRTLFQIKAILVQRLNELFPEPAASFAGGILLGTRSAIPKNVIDDFRRSGLTHIIALSGFNIVILIQFISLVLSGLPRKISSIVSIIIVIIFTLLVGASASVVRAAIMGCLSLIGGLHGRKSSALRALCITGYVMALVDPFVPIYDIGFQLSFGATAGILVFTKRWQERFKELPKWLGIKDALITTIAAQVFTLPFIIYYFHAFSLVSPIANIPVLPLIPLLMLGSFLSLLFGKIIAAPTWIVFKITLAIIHFFASVPFGFIDFGIS